jgi:DNA primase
VIAVEGYVDVIAMTRAGLPHTVAPLGTALTEEQLGLLWRMAEEPILCFDGDKAGLRAAYRALDIALPALAPGKSLRFVFLPEGQDPDDLLRKAGAAAVQAAVDRTVGFAEVLWQREAERAPLDTPERRADLEKRLNALVAQIRDAAVKRNYKSEFDQRLGDLNGPRGGRGRGAAGQRGRAFSIGVYGSGGSALRIAPPRFSEPPNLRTVPMAVSAELQRTPQLQDRQLAFPLREALLIMGAINHPSIALLEAEVFAELEFENREIGRLQQALVDCIAQNPAATRADLIRVLEERGHGVLLAKVERALDSSQSWAALTSETNHATRSWRQAADLQLRVSSLRKELEAAIRDYDDTEEAFEQIRHLRERLSVVIDDEDG